MIRIYVTDCLVKTVVYLNLCHHNFTILLLTNMFIVLNKMGDAEIYYSELLSVT